MGAENNINFKVSPHRESMAELRHRSNEFFIKNTHEEEEQQAAIDDNNRLP